MSRFWSDIVHTLTPYVPGEQPALAHPIKLNTNENPFPPSPKVLRALKKAVDGRLRLYPNPTAQPLREKLARLHRCKPDNIIVGNGSDELLALAVRCFVEPQSNSKLARATVQYFTPSYSLYSVLANIHGAIKNSIPLQPNFSLPGDVTASKRYWVEDIIEPEVSVTRQGVIHVPTGPGMGFELRVDLIDKLTVRSERLV